MTGQGVLLVQLEVGHSLQKGSAQHDMLTGYIPAARLPATIDACAREMAERAGTFLYNTQGHDWYTLIHNKFQRAVMRKSTPAKMTARLFC